MDRNNFEEELKNVSFCQWIVIWISLLQLTGMINAELKKVQINIIKFASKEKGLRYLTY